MLWLFATLAFASDCPDPVSLVQRAESDTAALYLADALHELDAAVDGLACSPLATPELVSRMWRVHGWIAMLQGREERALEYFGASRALTPDAWTSDLGEEARAVWASTEPPGGTVEVTVRDLALQDLLGLDGTIVEGEVLSIPSGPHLQQIGELPDASRYARQFRLPDGTATSLYAPPRAGTSPDDGAGGSEKDSDPAAPPADEPNRVGLDDLLDDQPREDEAPSVAFAMPAPLQTQRDAMWTLGMALGGVMNNPFLRRYDARLQLGIAPSPHVGVEVGVDWFPVLGDDTTHLTKGIVETGTTQGFTRELGAATFTGTFVPIWGRARIFGRPRPAGVVFRIGGGLIQTQDDLAAPQAEDDPELQATQVHPVIDTGLALRLFWTPSVAIEVGSRRLSYIENFGTAVSRSDQSLFQLGVSLWPGGVL